MIRPSALAALFLILAGSVVRAQPSDPPPSAPANPPAGRITVDEAVAAALRNNPTLEAARHQLKSSLIGADHERPAFRPEVTAKGSQYLSTPRVDLPGRHDDVVIPNSFTRLEITLKQQLYQFGIGSAPGRRADAMAAAARADYRTAELDLALEAREAYLQAVGAEAQLQVAREGLKLAEENVALTKLLIERGFQADVDLIQAQKSQGEAEAGVVKATTGVDLAKQNLNRVLDRPLDTEVILVGGDTSTDEPPPVAELTARALKQRPELEALRQNIEQAEAGIRLAKAQRLPRVDVQAGYALQTETALLPHSGFGGGVTITAPIFNGPADRYTVRQAEVGLDRVRAGVRAREAGISLEVSQHHGAILQALKLRVLALAGIEGARKAYDIKRLSLERGRAIQTEVSAARFDLIKALTDAATAENDLRLARARLERALGEGAPAAK